MQRIVKRKIGRETISWMVEGKNIYECEMQAQKLSFPDVEACGICKGDNIKLYAHLEQNKYKYIEIKCQDMKCRASLVLGSTTEDPDMFYLRKNKETNEYDWKPYVKAEKK